MKRSTQPLLAPFLISLVLGTCILAQDPGAPLSSLPQVPKPDFSALTTARVLQVVDGDTVKVDLGGQEPHAGSLVWTLPRLNTRPSPWRSMAERRPNSA